MEMSYLFDSMYRIRGKRIAILSLLLFALISGPFIMAQEDPDILERAFAILEERGEVVFEFYPDDNSTVNQINLFISVDRKTAGGFEAYANEEGFREFLGYDIPFKLIERQAREKSGTESGEFPGDWDNYPSHDQYFSFMEGIADKYPEICRLDTIGQSVDGRHILYMKITDTPDLREPEPAFVYSSTMHGDETTGYVLLIRLIDYLCSNYGSDSLVTKLVDNIEIWINPLANPDGTYWEGDSVPSLPKRFNSNGVDLNRNFPSLKEFGLPDYTIYQPENLAQMNFLRNIYMVMGANIHDGAEVVNYPFDTWRTLHADNEWFIHTSREYADEAQKRSYPVLYMSGFDDGITNGWDWYKVEGGRQDWVNYFIHAREVTIEISLEKYPPSSELPNFWYYNYPSMLRYMEQSLFGIHGIILDESTGKAIKASIRVLDYDTLHSDIYSDSLSGYFARLIEPGTWVLEISAPGFDSVVVTGVQVHPDQATWLDVSLTPPGYGVNVRDGLELSPNPFIYQAALSVPVSVPGPHRIYLYDIRGQMVLEDLIFCEMTGIFVYSLEGSHLDQGIYLLKLISPTDTRTLKIFKSL